MLCTDVLLVLHAWNRVYSTDCHGFLMK
jgi:hypothetical protein